MKKLFNRFKNLFFRVKYRWFYNEYIFSDKSKEF